MNSAISTPRIADGAHAVHPPRPAAGAQPVHQRIALKLIDVPKDRLSEVRAERVETIGKTAKAVGLIQAVAVIAEESGRYTLLAGAKRLAALDLAGETEIDARVWPVGSLDADGRRLVEIIENLDRQALTKLEFAEYLAALKDIHERIYPSAKNGGDRRSRAAQVRRQNQNEIFSFRSDAAEKTGMSIRAIEMAVAMVCNLTGDAKARVRGTWLEDHQAGLKLLSEQHAGTQERVLDILFAVPPEATSVAEALIVAGGRRPPTASEKRFASTLGNFGRFSAAEREAFLDAQEELVKAHARKRGWL